VGDLSPHSRDQRLWNTYSGVSGLHQMLEHIPHMLEYKYSGIHTSEYIHLRVHTSEYVYQRICTPKYVLRGTYTSRSMFSRVYTPKCVLQSRYSGIWTSRYVL
jgi:hypothetical protein